VGDIKRGIASIGEKPEKGGGTEDAARLVWSAYLLKRQALSFFERCASPDGRTLCGYDGQFGYKQ
jgi:hypothetical protein